MAVTRMGEDPIGSQVTKEELARLLSDQEVSILELDARVSAAEAAIAALGDGKGA